jgi:hypothetical protein
MTKTEWLEYFVSQDKASQTMMLSEAAVMSGTFDSGLACIVGEAIAVRHYGLAKTPRGTPGVDGYIRGERVSVKTKEPSDYRNSFVQLKPDLADAVMVIRLQKDGSHSMTYAPINRIKPRPHKQGPRYYLSDIEKAEAPELIPPIVDRVRWDDAVRAAELYPEFQACRSSHERNDWIVRFITPIDLLGSRHPLAGSLGGLEGVGDFPNSHYGAVNRAG